MAVQSFLTGDAMKGKRATKELAAATALCKEAETEAEQTLRPFVSSAETFKWSVNLISTAKVRTATGQKIMRLHAAQDGRFLFTSVAVLGRPRLDCVRLCQRHTHASLGIQAWHPSLPACREPNAVTLNKRCFFFLPLSASATACHLPPLLSQGREFMSKLTRSMERDEVLPMLPFEKAFVKDLLGMVFG